MVLVKYNAKNVYYCGALRLIPGVNEVAELSLIAVQSHPLFKHRVDSGIIEILDEVKGKKKNNEAMLVRLMPEVYDVKLLKKYMKSGNASVACSAKKQFERIESVEVNEEKQVELTIK